MKHVNFPKHPELKVKRFWKHIQKTPKYLEYFPDYKDSQLAERVLMFNLLYTIDPDLVVNKVIESNNERKLITKEIEREYIKIKSNLLEEIKDLDLLPSSWF